MFHLSATFMGSHSGESGVEGMGVARIFSKGNTFWGRLSGGGGQGAELRGRKRIFENLQKNFLRELRKCIFSIFFRKFNKPCINFRAFGRKAQIVGKFWENFNNFWWKFNRKIEFLIIFWKFLTKIIAFGNNTIFPRQFFQFRGAWLRPWWRGMERRKVWRNIGEVYPENFEKW